MLQKPRLLALGLFLTMSAFATSVNFSFDTQTIGTTTITGLSSLATAAQIQAYMNQVLTAAGCSGCSVVVATGTSGAGISMGAVADKTYNGEGYVTGPGTRSQSLTLGDSNGAKASSTSSSINSTYDTFIANTNDNSTQVSNQITIQFKNVTGLTVNSFDYEIFPCANGYQSCTSPPGLTFEAGNNNNGADAAVASFGTGGTQVGVIPGTTDGNATMSPKGSVNSTAYDQYIGTWTAGISGVSELDFVDWPATIGIDNLNVSWTTSSPVPEPASIVLFGTLVVFLAKKLRRVQRRQA